MPSPNPLPLIHLAPAILTFLLLPEHAKHTSAPIRFSFVDPSSCKCSSQVCIWSAPSLPSDFTQISLHERTSLIILCKRAPPLLSYSLAALFFRRYLLPSDTCVYLSCVPTEHEFCLYPQYLAHSRCAITSEEQMNG